MMTSHGFSLKRCILDAIFSGLIALIIFGPIAGVVLDGYSFTFDGQRLAWMVGIVMAGYRCRGSFPGALRGRQRGRLCPATGLQKPHALDHSPGDYPCDLLSVCRH